MSVTDNKLSKNSQAARSRFIFRPVMDGVLTAPAITANADPTKFDVSAFVYRLGGQVYAKAATTANVFSAIHATGIGAWLGIGLYIDERGTLSTLASPNTGDQDYGTEALALASIPVSTRTSLLIGTFTLRTNLADWDANTDSLAAADLLSSNLLGFQPDRRLAKVNFDANMQVAALSTDCKSYTATAYVQALVTHEGFNGPVTNPNVEVDRRTVADATVTKLRCGAFDYMIDGVLYHTDAQKEIAFSAAHVVALDKWGAILLQINAAGTISTKVSGATQTTPQTYTNSASARAALPDPTAGSVGFAVLVVEAGAAAWDANTDDIVAASDLEAFDLFGFCTDRALDDVTLGIDAVPEKFTIAAFDFSIGGVKYAKTAATAITFSAAHVCAIGKYLAILVQIVAAGTVSTRVPLIDGRSQTASQGFDSYDAAVAALPNTENGKLAVGYIVVQAGAAAWDANTDDMTPGSDLTNVWFVGFKTNQRNGVAGVETTNQNALWPVSAAAFAAETVTDAAFDGGSDPRPMRTFGDGTVALYLGATVTGAVGLPSAMLTMRPFPLDGETAATAVVVG
jgi:hypothetical protein